jgi:hypothetical protein
MLTRCGDQVPDPASGQQVLGREQPVVAGQGHPAAQRHRLAQQPGAEPTGHLGRDRGGEEHPRVRADPDRETSRATGTCRARPALTYIRASSIASGPSKSAASHQVVTNVIAAGGG